MGFIQLCGILLLLLPRICLATENVESPAEDSEVDLVAVESRYKVDAKPEPYRPPRPAPQVEDSDPPPATTRKVDKAEIIYPTTTYRPVSLYLPTKAGEKFVPAFNKKKFSSETFDIVSKEQSGSKKRIRKVKKVLRNQARKQKNLKENLDDSVSAETEVRSLTASPKTTSKSTTSATPIWQERTTVKEEPSFPYFQQSPDKERKSKFSNFEDSRTLTTDIKSLQPSSTTQQPRRQDKSLLRSDQRQQQHRGEDNTRGNKKHQDDLRSRQTEVKSLQPSTKSSFQTTVSPHWQDKSTTRQPQAFGLFQHSGDEEVQTNKKSRGLPILSQLGNRPVNPVQAAPFFEPTSAVPIFDRLPVAPAFDAVPAVSPFNSAVSPFDAAVSHFDAAPTVPTFNPAPVQTFEPVSPAAHVTELPPRSLPPPAPTVSNEIFGSSLNEFNIDENYDYDPDYEVYKGRPYAFTYGVKDDYSGTDFSRNEESSGQVTKGSYQVALPDGRIQIVSYVADINGFKATVSYEGEAVYPSPGQYGSYVQPLAQPVKISHELPLPVEPVTPLPNIQPLLPQEPHPSSIAPVDIIDDDSYYDNDIYDEVVPLPPAPFVKSFAPNRNNALAQEVLVSPTPQPVFASTTTKSFLPTYPHFEPSYHQDDPLPYIPPAPQVTPIPTTPQPFIHSSTTPVYQSPSPIYSSSTPVYLPTTYPPEIVTPGPTPYSQSTTVRSLPPLPGSYGNYVPSELEAVNLGYQAPTTFRPEYEFYGSARKRQVNNSKFASEDLNAEESDSKTEGLSDGDEETISTDETENQDFSEKAQIVIAEKLPPGSDRK